MSFYLSLKEQLSLMSVADLEKERARQTIRPEHRRMIEDELRNRGVSQPDIGTGDLFQHAKEKKR